MSEPAEQPSPVPSTDQLLESYLTHVHTLPVTDNAKADRVRKVRRFLAGCPDVEEWWRTRPLEAKIADIRRSTAHMFIEWLLLEGHLRPDLPFLLRWKPARLWVDWARRHAHEVARVRGTAERLRWSRHWVRLVSQDALGLMCLWAGKRLDAISDADFAGFLAEVEEIPGLRASYYATLRGRLFGLHQACYQLGLCQAPPREWHRGALSASEHLAAVPQPEIRRVMERYVEAVSATLEPGTVHMKRQSLIVLADYLAAHHPEVRRLTELERERHIEGFLTWNRTRPYRGKKAHLDRQVSKATAQRTVADLRMFFADLALWGWEERPKRALFFHTDNPKKEEPLPRALSPDADRDLMREIRRLEDPFARCGLIILRGTGIRIGELLDLELDCLWDTPTHGTWVKVPLGKLKTERMVPIDAETLEAFDAWMALRGPQRAIPHPRHGKPVEFLFMERGRRLAPFRLHDGLREAATRAGMKGPDGEIVKFTPHQLRHTYGTTLLNAGIKLEALMALMGHVTPEMTLRYARLAAPTIRAAYEEAMEKVKARRPLPIVGLPAAPAAVPDRVEWLRSEMLKTRVAHGYCSRHLAAEACPYANICEQCDNFVTAPEFLPALQEQLADVRALKEDGEARGWDSEVARHARVIASIERHIAGLKEAGG